MPLKVKVMELMQKRIIFASVIINKFGSACEEREKLLTNGS